MDVGRWRVRVLKLACGSIGVGTMFVMPHAALAQVLQGSVVHASDNRTIPGALVRLMDAEDEVLSYAVADSSGRYSMEAPRPGEYRIATEAYGYHPFQSLLLGVGDRASYQIDIELTPAPVPLPGFTVTADRLEELERGLRLLIGISPRSLRNEPILRPEIENHIVRAHGVADLVRWSNLPSITTKKTTDGPCFQWRARHCMPVFLNGVPVASDMVPVIPLDMVETILVLGPGETIAYNLGAVLLYTVGWIG